MRLSIIVPAYNEEKLLPETLRRIKAAMEPFADQCELIVVDNDSTDKTREFAESFGSTVLTESIKNIGAIRNTGAKTAKGDVLVFFDADTFIPENLLTVIDEKMSDTKCFGGAVDVDYGEFKRWWLKFMKRAWKFWGPIFNMKQGAAQFFRRSVFLELGGYDERIYLGEDIDIYWRLTKYAKRNGGELAFIEDPTVITSPRRFEKMSVWETMVLTHPVYILLNWKRSKPWRKWYDGSVR
jgi:glycosyltransferase involved in cell wall biosynthesis